MVQTAVLSIQVPAGARPPNPAQLQINAAKPTMESSVTTVILIQPTTSAPTVKSAAMPHKFSAPTVVSAKTNAVLLH